SDATNLAGTTDNNATSDVFVRDVVNGTTTRVSVASDGTEANGPSFEAAISGDGTRVVFTSTATNLAPGDTNDRSDVFVHDMATGATVRASVGDDESQGNSDSSAPDISGNGRYVAFRSSASNLVTVDGN